MFLSWDLGLYANGFCLSGLLLAFTQSCYLGSWTAFFISGLGRAALIEHHFACTLVACAAFVVCLHRGMPALLGAGNSMNWF
jgi:hypothetical protein